MSTYDLIYLLKLACCSVAIAVNIQSVIVNSKRSIRYKKAKLVLAVILVVVASGLAFITIYNHTQKEVVKEVNAERSCYTKVEIEGESLLVEDTTNLVYTEDAESYMHLMESEDGSNYLYNRDTKTLEKYKIPG